MKRIKAYVITYTLEIMTAGFNLKREERKESFTNMTEFIDRVKHLDTVEYCTDLQVYTGELDSLSIQHVLYPF